MKNCEKPEFKIEVASSEELSDIEDSHSTDDANSTVADLLDIMIVQFRNEKVSNHGSIPITIDCNIVAFIVFEEGFHQPIKRTKQSVFLDVTVFRHTLVD
ncbi:hypothetical protein TNCV_2671941 [Trichonephila clavipes]|nr:hypothetical protein TNCV_2671941 [Trichonephila clavipes]